jgi:signal transduction histidine kinase
MVVGHTAATIASMRAELRSTVAVVVPAVLLGVLAMLQYRWIDEVSHAERERARIHLAEGARRFGFDLATRIAAVRDAFRVPAGASLDAVEELLAARWRQHSEDVLEPQLVRDVWIVHPSTDGSAERVVRLDPARGEFDPVPSGEAERTLLAQVATGPPLRLERDLAALVQPIGGRMMRGGGGSPAVENHASAVVIGLDRGVMFDQLLPELADRWFGGAGGLEGAVALLDASPQHRRHVVWTSDPTIDWSGSVEIEVPVQMPGSAMGMGGRRRPRGAPMGGDRPARLGGQRTGAARDRHPAHPEPFWIVAVAHRAGSLDAAVDAARTRNLAVASAVLVLLAGSFALSLLATRRARRMARQQVDFVAGVTHELKTPLAAIRSAGENLADGIVSDEPSVREYGALVTREGRRLSEMVTELLEIAGLQGGRRDPVLAQVTVDEVVHGALEDCQWTLDESGVEVEVDLASELPPILGERSALRRALHNLIHNAATYGSSGGWVGVTATAAPRASRAGVAITVADRGPGIPRGEQSRVFEPFVRGREAGAVRASGSGLGLAVVRHVVELHAGEIKLDSDRSGTSVTLWLPAAPAAAVSASGEEEAAERVRAP